MMYILNTISYITLLFTFSLLSAITFMVVYDHYNPPSLTKTIYSDKEVIRGTALTVLNEVTRFRDCRVISSREVTNIKHNRIYELDPIDRDVEKSKDGKSLIREVTVDIARYMEPGDYTYQSVLNYYCNITNYFMGPIVMRTPLIHFKVLE